MTVSERTLWTQLRRNQLGVRFRRQVPIGEYIVDFASLDPPIAIEVDDPSHYWRDEAARSNYLQQCGFALLRYTNREVALELEAVVAHICTVIKATQRGTRAPEW